MATKASKTSKTSKPTRNGPLPTAPEVLTVAEAAAFLRVPEAGLEADAKAGRVPGRLVAGQWRFGKATLLAWLSQPEPTSNRPKTGVELVERIREINSRSGFRETPEEVEAFISKLYQARKADSVGA
ncbi:MAG TPA: helix-turn-helix domain-containing protein [Gemmata sp.]|nr:helix-turn-helix domain-containing protein [Gemmata sp.]